MFSECPSFFVLFGYNHGALNLHLHVVAVIVGDHVTTSRETINFELVKT